MTILAAAWESDTLVPLSVGAFSESTTTTLFTTFAREALQGVSGTNGYDMDLTTTIVSGDTLWTSFYCIFTATNTFNAYVLWQDGGTAQYRLRATSTFTASSLNIVFERWNGTAWAQLGNGTLFALNSLTKIDVMLKISATVGELRMFYGMSEAVITFDGDTSSQTSQINNVRFTGHSTAGTYFSEMIAATTSTRGMRLRTLAPTAAGTYSEWTGAYTAVDEIGYSLADSVSSNTVNQRFTYNMTDTGAPVPAAFRVDAVVIASRSVLEAASTPTDIQHMIREGGTDTTTANLGQSADGIQRKFTTIYATNPRTSAVWTLGQVDALEAGVKAV